VSKSAEAITALGDGAFRVDRGDGTHVVAYAVTDGPKTWVFLDGITHVVETARRGRAAGGHDAGALAAPMPATVTRIHVAVGQAVAAGDVLVTLEAMKMELPITATARGTVAAINCRVGELVQPGVPLVELRNSEPEHDPRTKNSEA
jgi:biotin carboxyl carrier protein